MVVVSGESGEALAGATVRLGAAEYLTDGSGSISLRDRVDLFAPLDASKAGYFDRQTSIRARDDRTFALWPLVSASGLNQHVTATLVYTSTVENAPLAGIPLERLRGAAPQVVIVLADNLRGDPRILQRHEEAAAEITAATGRRATFRVGADATGATRVDATYNPRDTGCKESRAFARTRLSGGEVTSATITYCVEDAPRSPTVGHELGHVFGFGHSPDVRDLMYPVFERSRPGSFSDREALLMRLMLQRRAGNRFPDSDRGPGASAAARERITYCPASR